MQIIVILYCFLIYSYRYNYPIKAINVALHAQVYPTDHQVVGSVITTNGLLQAFHRRYDIHHVEIFYPSHYAKLIEYRWDIVIIEGWFPSIHDFIWRCQSINSYVIVLFYCLDPTYPSLDVTLSLDVDGYITNSKYLKESVLSVIAPTLYLPLAADPIIMKRYSIPKKYHSIYIGAGGNMLYSKPNLHHMLLGASKVGKLAIYGSNWENIPILKEYWKGSLPVENISLAYSEAYVVLASTIASQSNYGMINNRIFEALACGAVILSDYFPELKRIVGNRIFYVNTAEEVEREIGRILSNRTIIEYYSIHGRRWIESYHTWDHRIPSILDFYHSLKYNYSFVINSPDHLLRNRQPSSRTRLCFLVSERIRLHGDYLSIMSYMIDYLKTIYDINIFYENIDLVHEFHEKIRFYDIIIAMIIPFDSLNQRLRQIDRRNMKTRHGLVQKRVAYYFGIDSTTLPLSTSSSSSLLKESKSHEEKTEIQMDGYNIHDDYDVILYRNLFDMELLGQKGYIVNDLRIQHVFGISSSDVTTVTSYPSYATIPSVSVIEKVESIPNHIVVCFIQFKNVCNHQNIMALIGLPITTLMNASMNASMNSSNIPIDSSFQSNIIENIPYLQLLIGNSKNPNQNHDKDDDNDWKEYYEQLHYSQLHKVMHFSYEALPALREFLSYYHYYHQQQQQQQRENNISHTFYIMNQQYTYSINESFYSTVDYELSSIISILKYAVLSSSRIKFWTRNDYIMRIIDTGAHSWDKLYLDHAINLAFQRIIGFATSLSTVQVIWIPVNQSEAKVIISESKCLEIFRYRQNSIVFKLDYEFYEPGRDGECCIVIESEIKQCMIAKFQYFAITVKSSNLINQTINVYALPFNFNISNQIQVETMEVGSFGVNNDKKKLESVGKLSLRLRGNIAADFFYEYFLPYDIVYEIISQDPSENRKDSSVFNPSEYCSTLDIFDFAIILS